MATNIIDPNDAIASQSLINIGLNGTPDYSDMFIFAELTAQRRKASIIDTEGVGKKRKLTDAYDATVINMMGFDNDSGKYTTKWTNNIGENASPYEGFGMTKIDVVMNSSYVPQIDIEFVDVRGLSLVSLGTKSKYSVLYSFPPPIFTLTIKGYYGKAISYDLHLVSQSTRFEATSGNYFINAKFVGSKYGNLTDVLFKYIDIVPLMNDNTGINGENNSAVNFKENEEPKNTRELITRAKKLYDDIDKIKIDSKEAIELDNTRKEITDVESLIDSLSIQSILLQTPPDLKAIGYYINESNSGLLISTSTNIRPIKSVSDYNSIIKGLSPNEVKNIDKRLCLLYEYSEKVNGQQNFIQINSFLPNSTSQYDNIIAVFTGIKDTLLKLVRPILTSISDDSIVIINENTIPPSNGKKYIGLDLSIYYTEIKQYYTKKTDQYNQVNTKLKNNVNDLAQKNLGFMPTIKNIFTILANDVDVFYRELRKTCVDGENSHKKEINFNQIVNNNETKQKNIAPFPLILKPVSINDKIQSKQRAYPGDPSLGFGDAEFPEVDFVENFINAFIKVIKSDKISNLKSSIDADGNYRWIPVNPLDSDIAIENGSFSTESPYKNIYNIPDFNKEALNRFYISSQYSYGFLFYEIDGSETIASILEYFGSSLNTKNNGLIEYLAEGEANNLVNTIIDLNLLDSLSVKAGNWASSDGVNIFYKTLEDAEIKDTSIHYSNFNDQLDPLYPSTNYVKLNGIPISKNRESNNYVGFELLTKPPVLRNVSNTAANGDGGETNYVDKFIENVGDTGFFNDLLFDKHGFDGYTKQNIPYMKDIENGKDKFDSDFLSNRNSLRDFFGGSDAVDDTVVTNIANSITNLGATKMLAILNDTIITNEMKAYFIVGAMLNTISYFSGPEVNKKFAFPSVIEVPKFAHLFMGALAYFFKFNNINDPDIKPKIDYFIKTYGFAELYDPNKINALNIKKISEKDAIELDDKYFQIFVNVDTGIDGNFGFNNLKRLMIKLVNDVALLNLTDSDDLNEQYEIRLEPKSKVDPNQDASFIIKILLDKLYLLNYTQISFLPFYNTKLSGDLSSKTFTPLKDTNNNPDPKLKSINDKYFITYFKKIRDLCKQKRDELNKLESSFREGIADNDIKNQTYYSFKAIADKWVIGLEKYDDTALIEDFMFVDRFFNEIGDKVIIDIRPLIDLSQDYDVSVYSVMSKILALNGFEFFPLQNFINFEQEEWANSFKTYGSSRNLIKNQTPRYVCMYIGGTSSQLGDPLSGYDDDGFDSEAALLRSKDYNVDNVKGFKVHFAKQNQSMFTSIQLDTNEHKETNESLAILSELAKDQSASSPVPKGQNLYSTYEQRSYSCSVEGLGNALIQPTQYFILENVPMFNGAYLILEVKHSIVPNTMKTNFMGVRVRTNSNPIVTEFATSIGLESGEVTMGTSSTENEPTQNSSGDAFNPKPINDMNKILISPKNGF